MPSIKPASPSIDTAYLSTARIASPFNQAPPLDYAGGRRAFLAGRGVAPKLQATGFAPTGWTPGPSLKFRQGDKGINFAYAGNENAFPFLEMILFKHDYDPALSYVNARPFWGITWNGKSYATGTGIGFGANVTATVNGFHTYSQLQTFGVRIEVTNTFESFGSAFPARGVWHVAIVYHASSSSRYYHLAELNGGTELYSSLPSGQTNIPFNKPSDFYTINPSQFLFAGPGSRGFVGEVAGLLLDFDTYSIDGTGANKSIRALASDPFRALRGAAYSSSLGTAPVATSVAVGWPGPNQIIWGCPKITGGRPLTRSKATSRPTRPPPRAPGIW